MSSSNAKILRAVFMALSSGLLFFILGNFFYVSTSEIIVEEFAVKNYKYTKFITYLLGGILIGVFSVFLHYF